MIYKGWSAPVCLHTAGVTGSIPVPPTNSRAIAKERPSGNRRGPFFFAVFRYLFPRTLRHLLAGVKKDNQPACFVRVALAPNRGHSPRYVQLTVAQRKESCRHNGEAARVATHATPQQALNANGAGITPASVGAVGGNSYRSVTYKHASAPVELGTLSAPPRLGALAVRVVTTDCCA